MSITPIQAKATTAFHVIAKANERGEVGYAEPLPGTDPDNTDWAAVQEALDEGWIVYGYDASPDRFSKFYGQRRTVYHLTAAGRQALADAALGKALDTAASRAREDYERFYRREL